MTIVNSCGKEYYSYCGFYPNVTLNAKQYAMEEIYQWISDMLQPFFNFL